MAQGKIEKIEIGGKVNYSCYEKNGKLYMVIKQEEENVQGFDGAEISILKNEEGEKQEGYWDFLNAYK